MNHLNHNNAKEDAVVRAHHSKLFLAMIVSLAAYALVCLVQCFTYPTTIAIVSLAMCAITLVAMIKAYKSQGSEGLEGTESVQGLTLFLRWKYVHAALIAAFVAFVYIALIISAFGDKQLFMDRAKTTPVAYALAYVCGTYFTGLINGIGKLGNAGPALMLGAAILVLIFVVFWLINLVFAYQNNKENYESILKTGKCNRPYHVHLYTFGIIELVFGLLMLLYSMFNKFPKLHLCPVPAPAIFIVIGFLAQGLYLIFLGTFLKRLYNDK